MENSFTGAQSPLTLRKELRPRDMASIEKIVGNLILEKIRSRRESPSDQGNDSGEAASLVPAKVREAQFSDYEAITNLKRRWGLTPDPLENWIHLWRDNPALNQMQTKRSIGWVLEAEGKIVGYLASISSLYRFGDRTLTAVIGSGFVAEPAYRAHTVRLMGAFYAQKPVDLYLSTTAVEATGKIACAFGCEPMPQEDYATVMFWVLRPYPFLQTVMKKLQIKPGLSPVVASLGSLAMGIDKFFRRRWPRRSATDLTVSKIKAGEIGEEFEALWNEKLGEGTRLLADRSMKFLRWHYDVPGDGAKTSVICCRRNGQLLGYLVIRDEAGLANGLRRSLVADMLVKQDAPETIGTLIVAAYNHARRAGSDVLEVQGFPAAIRRLFAQWKPYNRTFPATPFFYKAAASALQKTLADGAAWYPTPFDGDTTLMPELSDAGEPSQSANLANHDPCPVLHGLPVHKDSH